MEKVLNQVLEEISTEKAYEHIEFLVHQVGERLAGTEQLERAANYIRDEMENYGLETRIDHFPMYHSKPIRAELRVTAPETRIIEAKPACHICSTLPEGIEGELVFLNAGSYEDYEGKDVKDKIVLTRLDQAPRRPEKTRIALEKGAKALIIMNWGPLEGNPVIQMGAVKSQWGNPTPETFKEIPQIPVISITRAAGEYLSDLSAEQRVKVWVRAEATREWVTANQPVGFLRCQSHTEEFILLGGHLEAWGKTAICNSSGNSLMLEIARVLAKHKNALRRNLVFAFWDGHEIAEAAGSTWFVDNKWDDLSQRCIAYINIDNAGILGTRIPSLIGVTELKECLESIVERIWGEKSEWYDIYKGGDQSFFGVGVPYAGFYTRYTPEQLKEYNYAFLSPWLHTPLDTIDKIDKDLYSKHLLFFTALVMDLCDAPIIPYNLVPVTDELVVDIKELSSMNGRPTCIDLDSLLQSAEKLKKCILELTNIANKMKSKIKNPNEMTESLKACANLINRTLIKVSRELSPILRSEAGRYGQDPYGYSLVGKPLPALYTPLRKIAYLSPKAEEVYLWETKLIKERNRISDAIINSIDQTEATLLTLQILGKR